MEIAATAHNGKEALEIFQENPTDIVVTDVEMPRMNGLELLREIRKLNSRTRGIILSGYDEFEYARTALRLDVEEYILKPINEDQLRDALIRAGKHLDELDRKKAGNMEDKIGWIRFLKGKLAREEEAKFYQMLPEIEEGENVFAYEYATGGTGSGNTGLLWGCSGSSGEQLWNYELFYCKQCNYRIRTASNML